MCWALCALERFNKGDQLDIQILQDRIDDFNASDLIWIYPENFTGFDHSKLADKRLKLIESLECPEDDASDLIIQYMDLCLDKGDSSLPKDTSKSLAELYTQASLYVITKLINSLPSVQIPYEIIDSSIARKCLPLFKDSILNLENSSRVEDTLQQYACDFYQFGDLWKPGIGKFVDEFTEEENKLVEFLSSRDLSLESLDEYGIPELVLHQVSDTKLIKRYLSRKSV